MSDVLDWLLIKRRLKQLINYDLPDDTIKIMQSFYELLIERNKTTNLTRITDPADAAIKHFLDSLLCLKYLNFDRPRTLLDVGTGPGFPGIPLKIVCPEMQVYLLESNNKKANFLRETAKYLDIRLNIISERAESYIDEHRMDFDYVTSRALGNPLLSLELCGAFVKKKGSYIQLMGPSVLEMLPKLKTLAYNMNMAVVSTDRFKLSDNHGERVIIVYNKYNVTPEKYPRNFSVLKNIYS